MMTCFSGILELFSPYSKGSSKQPFADSVFLRTEFKPDATGKFGVSAEQKEVASMRQLTHGIGADITEYYFFLRESTALQTLK